MKKNEQKTVSFSTVEARNGIFSARKTVEHLSSPKVVFNDEKNSLKVLVRNKHLGQSHRDILDVLWAQKVEWADKYIVKFHESAILKALGIAKAGRNVSFLRQKLLNIKDASIHVQNAKKEYVFDFLEYYEKQSDGTYIVIFDEKYIEFLHGTPSYFLQKDVLKKILNEKSAVVRATLRLTLSHRDFANIDLDDILLLFFPRQGEERARRRAKNELLAFCENDNFAGLKMSRNGYLIISKKETKNGQKYHRGKK